MKLKILKYCQEQIDNQLVALCVNQVINVDSEADCQNLLNKKLAKEFSDYENKMVDIVYKKKRGRPRKEV